MEESKDKSFEIGIYTLGEYCANPVTKQRISPQQRLQEIIETAKLADDAGLDVFGIGEHHQSKFVVSATSVVLAAIAQQTKNIKLTSATTILSTVDPVRLYEEFATLDLISGGRAEIIVGRGAFLDSFPLFGYDLSNYEALFEEKLTLLQKIIAEDKVTWKGKYRSALVDAEISPPTLQKQIPLSIGSSGTLDSAVRAGTYGVGMTLAMLSGENEQYKGLIDLYRLTKMGAVNTQEENITLSCHGFTRKDTKQVVDEYYPYYLNYMQQFMHANGKIPSFSKEEFQSIIDKRSVICIGSPEQMIEKILYQYELFQHNRLMLQIDLGGQPYTAVAKTIELLASEVIPVVKREVGKLLP